jgi:hypothetical protein
MSDLQEQNRKLLAACFNGDIPTLKTMFHELRIGPDQPQNPWDFDSSLDESQHTPSVQSMLICAIKGQKIETLRYLFEQFPGTSLNDAPIEWAISSGNVELVKACCELDRSAANGEIGHVNVLAYACSPAEKPDIVKVLLDHGADPNKEPQHTPPFPNICSAVVAGMPVSTIEQFFDAGYRFDDAYALKDAVRYKRPDILEAMFARGKDLPTAWYPPRRELLDIAEENNDKGMVAVINRVYPTRPRWKGMLESITGKTT